MATTIGMVNCASNYQKVAIMGSEVGDPIPAGIGCLTEADFDTIDAGSVSLFYESALEAEDPSDTPMDYYGEKQGDARNTLKVIPMNNFFDDSKKIFSAAANSLPYDKAATELTKLANKSARQNGKVELACLIAEGIPARGEAVVQANILETILEDQTTIRNTGANPTIAVCTPDFYAKLVIAAGDALKSDESNARWLNAQVGKFLDVLWVSSPLLTETASGLKYFNKSGDLEGVDLAGIDYVMWDGSKFVAINRINEFSIKDGGALFSGSAACMSSMLGVHLLEQTACIARYEPSALEA